MITTKERGPIALLRRLDPEAAAMADSASSKDRYEFRADGIYENYMTRHGPQERQLANFTAEILEDVEIDDGTNIRREFLIALEMPGKRREITVTEDEFSSVAWPIKLSVLANINPIPNAVGQFLTAIKLHSTSIVERKEYGHIGFRELADGTIGYLTDSGAITADGLRTDVAVRLGGALERYHLPAPPEGEALKHAVRRLLLMRALAPSVIADVALAALFRSVIQDANYSIFFKGRTGSGKTELAALLMQCFGAGMDAMHLPVSFESTENYIRAVTNRAHEALVVVDDFRRVEGRNLDKIADGIGQGAGNHSGRGRMNADTSLRSEDRPHGTVIMTGEDAPRGESLKARMIIIEFQSNSVNFDVLTQCQKDAAAGVYAAANAGFIQWLAKDLEGHRATLKQLAEDFRSDAREDGVPHARTASSVGDLLAGLCIWATFAVECGAITSAEAEEFKLRTATSLRTVIDGQAAELQSNNPVDMFDEALHAAITSGQAHVASLDNSPPVDPMAWGWREFRSGDGYEFRAQGPRIGWTGDGGTVYLEWRSTYDLIQKQAIAVGNRLPLTESTLLKRINERGLILSRDENRQTLKTRISVQGKRQNVVHYDFERLEASLISEKPDQPDHSYINSSFSSDSAGDSGADAWSGSATKPDQLSEKPDQLSEKPDQNGRMNLFDHPHGPVRDDNDLPCDEPGCLRPRYALSRICYFHLFGDSARGEEAR